MSAEQDIPHTLARRLLSGAAGIEKTLSLIDRASQSFLESLDRAAKAPRHPEIANALSWVAKDYSPVLRAFNRLDEAGIFSSALARACGAQLEPDALLGAHAAITTEITGPSTSEISKALAQSAIDNPSLVRFTRYGVEKTLWESCLLDFWREYDRAQMKSICELLDRADTSGRPTRLLGNLLNDAQFGIFFIDEFDSICGAIDAIPGLALETGLPRCIDNAAIHARPPNRPAAMALFELAQKHGMSLAGHSSEDFQTPEIKAIVESAILSLSIAPQAAAEKKTLRV